MKRSLHLILLSSVLWIHAQNPGNPLLVAPTTSSMASYIDTPASPATGIPNIAIPLYRLDTGNKNVPVNVTLSYHIYNAGAKIPVSEVGSGWSLFKAGIISKGLGSENKNWSDSNLNAFVYYNIPGHSGKFSVYKDTYGNVAINNITGEKLLIECTRDTSTTKFVISSFKITDNNGIQYFFEDYDLDLAKPDNIYINYRSAFVLTRVLDENNRLIISYQYDKKTAYLGTSTTKKYEYNKLTSITTKSGKIKFEYYDNNNNNGDDPYRLNKIILTDKADRILSYYQLLEWGTSYYGSVSKSTLGTLRKFDKFSVLMEETNFEYNNPGYSEAQSKYGMFFCPADNKFVYPELYTQGFLKKITFPTKGYQVFNYEANEMYEDKSNKDYTSSVVMTDSENQYYEKTDLFDFDTNNSATTTFNFPVNQSQSIYFSLFVDLDDIYYDNHGNIRSPELKVYRNNTLVAADNSTCNNKYTIYNANSGTTLRLQITGLGKGKVSYFQLRSRPKPYRNSNIVSTGVRLRSVQSFNSNGTLEKSQSYKYDDFSNPLNVISNLLSTGNCNDDLIGGDYMVYKNVKETSDLGTGDNGHIKYYFKTPDDYNNPPAPLNFIPYYTLTSSGVLSRKEIYNKQNQLVESIELEHTFEQDNNAKEYGICLMGSTKFSWLKKLKETKKSYFDSGKSFTTTEETTYNPNNLQESSKKITDAEGNVTESFTRYAMDTGDTRLVGARILSTPVEVESKTNGTTTAKLVTKYENTGHFYPTSLVSYDLAQNPETSVTFDVYDNKGNLVQSTDKTGISTVTIWGYHQTQPVAILTGAKYTDISSLATVSMAVTASDADDDNPANEAPLLTALRNLLSDPLLKTYTITCYTYDPLVGITNILSPHGIRTSYEYDDYSRLIRVKDQDGKLIKENQYNFKQ